MAEPVRTCVGCGAKRDKRTLVRVVACSGLLAIDARARLPGRGAYLCGAECAKKALSRKAFARAFKQRVATDASLPDLVERARTG